MTIKSRNEEQAKCFKYWPTGRECITFYFILFMTVVLMAVSIGFLISGVMEKQPCGVQCAFQGIVTTCIAFWLRSPVDYFN